MDYYQVQFTVIDPEGFVSDLLTAELSEMAFDTFEESDMGFIAYIPVDAFDENALASRLKPYKEQYSFSYAVHLVPHQNWNEVWESNFQPVIVSDQLYIRATFHPSRFPEFPLEIVIDPKMAFGTGHHETTFLMSETMLTMDLKGKHVLDMGCGSGILAILASKLGAADVLAVDHDPICVSSTVENAQLNHINNLKEDLGDIDAVERPAEGFDIILANINRNILLRHITSYAALLKPGGELVMSGFYEQEPDDLQAIRAEAETHGLTYKSHITKNNWVALKMNLDQDSSD